MVVQVGSGIGRIKELMKHARLSEPVFKTGGMFTVVLHRTVEKTPVAARFSRLNSNVKAFASLSGQYDGFADYKNLNKAVLFMRGNPTSDIGETLTGYDWDGTPKPKHRAEFVQGYHWDYLLPSVVNCNNSFGPGDCGQAAIIRAEIITMFFSRYLNKGTVNTELPVSLIPPELNLTPNQQFFTDGNYMQIFNNLGENCQVTLEWATTEGSGSEIRP